MLLAFAGVGVAQGGGRSTTQASKDDRSVGTIRGGVLLPNGAPLNQAVKIKLRKPQGTEVVIYTNFMGQFEFKDIATGNYELDAEADWQKYLVSTQSVQVMKDLTTVITFTLKEKPAKGEVPNSRSVVSVGELDKNIPKEARKEFERASKAAADNKSEEAIAHLQKALALYPDFMMAHNDLGAQLLDAGRFDEAAVELRAAVKLDPKAFNPRLNLGVVLLKQRQFAEAAQVIDQALALDSQSPAAHLYAGMAHLMLKDLDRAEKELLTAHETGGAQFALSLFHLGQLYLGKGDRPHALQSFEAYLQEAPEAANAEQVRKLIATLR
ncbi:MAG: tetratricopeptide repeat protein [Pyrinomonadaceae bacterium]